MLAHKLTNGGSSVSKLYVDDVFSTYLYTGNGSTQTINNGIDLAGNGGMVWIKSRNSAAGVHCLVDTNRGASKVLQTQATSADVTVSDGVTSFNSTGFAVGADAVTLSVNKTNDIYTSWTFRKAPKFFDIVTYTGNGVAGRQISHSLGVAPGMVIVKRTDTTSEWPVYHRGLTSAAYHLLLNTTDAEALNNGWWNSTAPTSTVFTVGSNAGINANGASYVAYIFAHDPSADGIIQCGSFTTDASGNATVNLGREPQFFLTKASSAIGDWWELDVLRGNAVNVNASVLRANSSGAETSNAGIPYPTSTGLAGNSMPPSTTFIYLAIRRPNKPPTSGTQVFSPVAQNNPTGGTTLTVTGTFPVDLNLIMFRQGSQGPYAAARLAGNRYLTTSSTASEGSGTPLFNGDGKQNSVQWLSAANGDYISWLFRRAPGVFDVVCVTSSGTTNAAVNHGLASVPELIVLKRRNSTGNWGAYHLATGNNNYLYLNLTLAATTETGVWPTGSTSAVVRINESTFGLGAGATYVAYLFATLPGISKVGSYPGNGTSQTINAGFTTGARFVLIKRTDSAGDWYVWDAARGIVSANDPRLSLNAKASEVTTDDSIDPDATGFIVNQNAATNINVTSGSYIYLAIA